MIADNGPYDVVHCFNEFEMAGSLAAAALRGVPVRIGHVHKTWNGKGGPLTRIYRRYCRRLIDRYATVRLGCSRLACDCCYSPARDAQVVSNPYDEMRFSPGADGAVSGGALRIVQVGYLCDNKNQRFTLEVFRRIAADLPDAELTFVGADSPYGQALKEEASAAGLQDRVTFLPPDADIPALFGRSTLLMLPSKAEGFGIVLVEAQAMGLFCYASDTVPKEADLGGVRFLPLKDGPGNWARTIEKERLFEQKVPRDCSAFTTAGMGRSMRRFYGTANTEEANTL